MQWGWGFLIFKMGMIISTFQRKKILIEVKHLGNNKCKLTSSSFLSLVSFSRLDDIRW